MNTLFGQHNSNSLEYGCLYFVYNKEMTKDKIPLLQKSESLKHHIIFFFFNVADEQYPSTSSRGHAAAARSLQFYLTLCDPIESSPPGSSVPGILQARTLEWVAISFSSTWKWKVKVKSLSRVRLLATPWTAAYQAPLSMGFSRQEHWSGVPLPSPSRGHS